jgi:hypothetical protein
MPPTVVEDHLHHQKLCQQVNVRRSSLVPLGCNSQCYAKGLVPINLWRMGRANVEQCFGSSMGIMEKHFIVVSYSTHMVLSGCGASCYFCYFLARKKTAKFG